MTRTICTLLVAATLPAVAGAQEQGWASKFFPSGLTHDFGTVAFGAQLTYKFPIKNIYNVPFQVVDAHASCGCTTARKPAQLITPLGTSELEVLMDTLRVPAGTRNVTITVTLTSVPSQPGEKIFSSTCYLTASFLSRGDLTFTPGKISFGSVPVGQSPKMSLDIERFNDPNWQVQEIVKNDLPLDANFVKLNFQGRNIHRVTVAMKPNAPAGEFKHELQLKTSDGKSLTLVVEGNIKAPIAASPNSFSLGAIKVGTAVLRHVIVSGTNVPYKITGVDGEGDGIKVKVQDKSAVTHVISIEYTPTKPEQLNKTLTIKTDLPGGMTATVKIEAVAD